MAVCIENSTQENAPKLRAGAYSSSPERRAGIYQGAKFPAPSKKFPARAEKFPAPSSREFAYKRLMLLVF
jgi:hypothetical protein